MIIALNNKCNFTKIEYLNYQDELSKLNTHHQLILCPSATYLAISNPSNYSLGSQNVSNYENGSHTGEISAQQLKSLGVTYCLVGHSERRHKETNEEITEKLKHLIDNDIIPILCIGEKKQDESLDKRQEGVKTKINELTSNLTEIEKEKIIIAYEPIWSIGTGIIPTNQEITELVTVIKQILPKNKVLYGGSVNEDNITILKQINNIDGFLLGGLSLQPKKLAEFLRKI